jgi:uncharacterized protein
VAFSRVLRGAGLDVPSGSVVTFTEALGRVGMGRREGVYWAARTTLLRSPTDRGRFDAAFRAFWLGQDLEATEEVDTVPVIVALDDPDVPAADEDEGEPEEGDVQAVRFSRTEVLRHKDFAAYTIAELDESRRLMADVRLAGALPVRTAGDAARPSSHGASGPAGGGRACAPGPAPARHPAEAGRPAR